jgi:hypothetical protein
MVLLPSGYNPTSSDKVCSQISQTKTSKLYVDSLRLCVVTECNLFLFNHIQADVNLCWRNVVNGLESKCQQSSTMVGLTIYACQIDPESSKQCQISNNVQLATKFS